MELDKTRAIGKTKKIVYRCTCGEDVWFSDDDDSEAADKEFQCPGCNRPIHASAVHNNLSMTIALGGGQTRTVGETETAIEKDDPWIGRKVGHFEILSALGHGGMGTVYRALDTALQRYVAVKIVQTKHREGDFGNQDERRLMQEAVSQARINHPNVVTIFYVGMEDKTPFFAMEICGERTIADLIRTRPLPFAKVSEIAIQVASALHTSYELGIVHGDVKPSNFLIGSSGEVKLSDFGLARALEPSDDHEQAIGGTPNYLAPEILDGAASSPQSDMYALGVALFELTFGRLPVVLSGSSLLDWKSEHEQASIEFPEPWPDDVPKRWRQLLTRLLEKNPDRRYANYDALISDLHVLQPRLTKSASRLPRGIAWCIDFALLGVTFSAVMGLLAIVGLSNSYLFSFVAIGILVVYSLFESVMERSVGHQLMQISIVNQYWLEPSRQKLIVRSILRMSLWWTFLLSGLLGFTAILSVPLLILGILFFLTDVAFGVYAGKGISLHDVLCKTISVLESSH